MKFQTTYCLLFSVVAAVGCASTGAGGSSKGTDGGGVGQLRSMVSRDASGKTVVVGPAALHVYAQFAGAEMYTVPVVSGTDRDCQTVVAEERHDTTRLPADRVIEFYVAPWRLACFSAASNVGAELLWHEVGGPVADGTMLARASAKR
jgi:hypothetical protein